MAVDARCYIPIALILMFCLPIRRRFPGADAIAPDTRFYLPDNLVFEIIFVYVIRDLLNTEE
ncbi:hypothetical protein [Pontibacter chinhatensis]|uniref:Uncharacterized protein n=1 Tax=Pontibacter chinhatensis TaxID=1436961 RepID=A0A1I2XNQ4_9BACT|nr:hypothetical protein [Pontibacter chinhatensis]SFH15123.1 hypothetical protein SAMN05421739_106158 [Pontibacter chinhatensis]